MNEFDVVDSNSITITQVVSLYLYGTFTPPSFEDRLRPDITPSSFYGVRINLDPSFYMKFGAGRYANISQTELAHTLFGVGDMDIETFKSTYLSANQSSITIAELLQKKYPIENTQVSISQHEMDINNPDYTQRTFVWSSGLFQLNKDAIIDFSTGEPVLKNVCLRPFDDDFDYISANPAVEASNILSVGDVDPFAIGRAVEFHFDPQKLDQLDKIDYGGSDFFGDLLAWQQLHNGSDLNGLDVLNAARDILRDSGVYQYDLDLGGKVIYGQDGDNYINAVEGYSNHYFLENFGTDYKPKYAYVSKDGWDYTSVQNKFSAAGDADTVIVSGGGNDTLVSGAGTDTIYSGGGDDILRPGLGSDFVDGGAGNDTLKYDEISPGIGISLRISRVSFGAGDILEVQDGSLGTIGNLATDTLKDIEKIELSSRPDSFLISAENLDLAITIDMGKSGRVQSELPPGETVSDNAFTVSVDVADYSQVDHGLIYIKGVTQAHTADVSFDKIFTTDGLGEELSAITDYSVGGILGYNDALHVKGADKIVLTDHDDVVISSDYGSIVYTGDGNDKVWFQDGVAIADLSDDDRISLLGVFTLYGGLKNGWSESPWAWGPYGTAYGLNAQGELVISNVFWQVSSVDANGVSETHSATTYVLNFQDTLKDVEGGGQLGAGHIFLLEYKLQTVLFRDITQDQIGKASAIGAGAFDLIGWMIKTMTGHSWYGGEDPLVLDLDDDGIELTPLDHAKARYDIDGDLYAEATGFVGGDDGILARDLNGNGQIDSSSEMFGQGSVSGFEILKTLDGNHDGVVDANDNALADFNGDGIIDGSDTFDKLLIWQDADEDLHTDVGELKSVSEWGITSFDIPSEITTPGSAENPATSNGNIINQTASYTKSDGSTHAVADVTLKVENQTTTYVGASIEVLASVSDLADLKGYGTLVSLHEAMSVRPDSETEVRAAVAALNTPDLTQLRVLIQPVLEAWALGSPIKIDGVVQTGVMSTVAYDDMIFIRKGDDVVDFTNSVSDVDSSGNIHLVFASGATLDVTLSDYSSSMSGDEVQGALRALLNEFFSPDSDVVVFASDHQMDGSYIRYDNDDGSVVLGNRNATSWIHSLAFGGNLATGASFAGMTANEFAFYERVMGESLEPFFETPDNASAGNDALEALISKMDTVLNTFAVRIAVQSGPLAHYFDSVDYDVVNNGFVSEAGHRISDVFHALLVDAEADAAPVTWLSEWKPFMDVFFADYSRGGSNLAVSYGYLVQQMMNAVERDPGGISVADYVAAFHIPDGLVSGGSGTVNGRNIEDIILIDGDEVLVQGGSGADNYIIGKNFHSAEIYDVDAALNHDFDTLRFSEHDASDIIATRDGIDLLLTDAVTGETLRITNEFEGRWPGPTIADASFDYGVDQIVFGDGTVWAKPDIALAVSRIDNNSTTVTGTADIDVLQGGRGDDRLEGAGDSDIYRYSLGDGADTINDFEDNSLRNDNDMLQFLNGIRISDLIFERVDNSASLTIKFKDHPGDQIIIENIFNATYTGVYGNWYQNRIELFTFDDGSSLTFDQVASLVLNTYSTSGNDHLYGMNRQDILVARQGNDYVSGGNESDTYLFNLGDGQDVYQDRLTNILSGTDDMMVFGAGISAGDIVFARDADHHNTLILTIAGTGDRVTLLNEYSGVYASVFGVLYFDQIETVHFHDEPNTVWTAADMAQMALDAEKTAGNDTIYGFDINNVIDGGAGNDFLSGGNGDDTYIWGIGYGNDTIREGGEDIQLANEMDTVIFEGGVNTDDIVVGRNASGSDLVITLTTTGETLTLMNQVWYTSINYHPDMVDRFQFADGTVWDYTDLREQYLVDAMTSGNDTIIGFYSNDTLNGGAGDDLLLGGDGSDTYLYGYGSGNDTIDENWNNILYSDDDRVIFGSGLARSDVTFARIGNTTDLLVTLTATGETLKVAGEFYTGNFDMDDVETFVFTDGTTVTEDDLRRIVLSSTSANETIYGFDKSDVYHYSAGGGNDTFVDAVNSGHLDKLVLDDLLQADVTFGRQGNDLLINVSAGSGGGVITLKDSMADYVDLGIELVGFADGTVLTRAAIRQLLISSYATAGDDTIVGTSASDSITAGGGNDTIDGGAGNDTYFYSRGDGNDTITETGTFYGNQDKLVLNGVAPSEVSFERTSDNLILIVPESSSGADDSGRITLIGTGSPTNESGIELIQFDDGTLWTQFDMRARYFASVSTSGNDTIMGFSAGDTIEGGRGNDSINGGGGNDTYIYSRGDGDDTITETGPFFGTQDNLVLIGVVPSAVTFDRSGNNLILVIPESVSGAEDGGRITLIGTGSSTNQSGIELIQFDDGTLWTQADMRARYFAGLKTSGNDTITGFSAADTIVGGLGDDAMNGAGGDDTYVYTRGDGDDTITENGVLNGVEDKLVLHNISVGSVSFDRTGDNLILVIPESSSGADDAGRITLIGTGVSSQQSGIELMQFDDGTIWSLSDMRARYLVGVSTNGNDTITGFNGAETITGGLGDDFINAGAGDDSYIYHRGDGNDTITEGSGNGTDKLIFTNINTNVVSLSYTGTDLILRIAESTVGAGDGGAIKLIGTLVDQANQGMESIVFADGTVWQRNDYIQKIVDQAGTSGDDVITGTSTSNAISGGRGNDVINGGAGDDTYFYARGDGNDVITESRSNGLGDKLAFTDINTGDISLSYSGTDLTISIVESAPGAGDSGSVKLIASLIDDNGQGVDSITFADGTTWNAATIRAQAIQAVQTNGNDTITGFNVNDTIVGGAGDDILSGGGGNDTYIYHRGDGNDTIDESASNIGATDTLVFSDISSTSVTLTRNGNDLIIIVPESTTGASDSGSILIKQSVTVASQKGIESIAFNNGVSWDRTQMVSHIAYVGGTSGNETITGAATNDVIWAGPGNDTLVGGGGNDTFVFHAGFGHDVINDFSAGAGAGDVLQFDSSLFATYSAAIAASVQVASDTVITTTAGDAVTLKNISMAMLNADDFAFV